MTLGFDQTSLQWHTRIRRSTLQLYRETSKESSYMHVFSNLDLKVIPTRRNSTTVLRSKEGGNLQTPSKILMKLRPMAAVNQSSGLVTLAPCAACEGDRFTTTWGTRSLLSFLDVFDEHYRVRKIDKTPSPRALGNRTSPPSPSPPWFHYYCIRACKGSCDRVIVPRPLQ